MLVYEIEFVTAAAEYEYEIDAVTGAIRERSIETRATAQPRCPSYIGVTRPHIALKHAALLRCRGVSFLHQALLEGMTVMQIRNRIHQGRTEYEYEIDAATGSVLEYDGAPSLPPQNDNRRLITTTITTMIGR